jgi:hypothetical protein
VVTCEGGNLSLSYNPLPSQNPRSPGMSPLGLTSLNIKNHPIEVTLGGIVSSYANLPLQSLAFYPCYKLRDNRPNKSIDVAKFIRSCVFCCKLKPTNRKLGLYPLGVRDRPREGISMNFFGGLLQTRQGHDYLFVVVIRSTRWHN